jgi:hypothetical protein
MKAVLKIVATIVAVIAGLQLVVLALNREPGPAKEEWRARYQAIQACHDGARERLKAPRSATFPSDSEVEVGVFNQASTFRGISIPKGSRAITSYVDAQNSFGALIRSSVSCFVSPEHKLLGIEVKSR